MADLAASGELQAYIDQVIFDLFGRTSPVIFKDGSIFCDFYY